MSIGIHSAANWLWSIRTSTYPRSPHLTATSQSCFGSLETWTLRIGNRPALHERCLYRHQTVMGGRNSAGTSSIELKGRHPTATVLCCTSLAHLRQNYGAQSVSSTHYFIRSYVQEIGTPTLSLQPFSAASCTDNSTAPRTCKHRLISGRVILQTIPCRRY